MVAVDSHRQLVDLKILRKLPLIYVKRALLAMSLTINNKQWSWPIFSINVPVILPVNVTKQVR